MKLVRFPRTITYLNFRTYTIGALPMGAVRKIEKRENKFIASRAFYLCPFENSVSAISVSTVARAPSESAKCG